MNTYHEGEYVVLKNKEDGKIVVGVMEEDFDNALGKLSLFKVTHIRGMVIESGVFNANMWEFVGETSVPKNTTEHKFVEVIYELLKINRNQERELAKRGY